MKNKYLLFFFVISCMVGTSCKKLPHAANLSVEGFDHIANLSDTLLMLDYTNAIDSGFIIPSIRQVKGGGFVFQFKITNKNCIPEQYAYKIYYQNESYKINELEVLITENGYHPTENFYGSWEDDQIGFKTLPKVNGGETILICDTLRIVGNPLNDKKYFGPTSIDVPIDEHQMHNMKQVIRADKPWYAEVQKKAKSNHLTDEEQLGKDAAYVILQERMKDTTNQRWKRNPRVGAYSFLLVVTAAKNLDKNIPDYIRYPQHTLEGSYVNPYSFFLSKTTLMPEQTRAIPLYHALYVKAKPEMNKGIFIPKETFVKEPQASKAYYRKQCNDGMQMYREATFEQFIHSIDRTDRFDNIADYTRFSAQTFTANDYKQNALAIAQGKKISTSLEVSDCPCKTVQADSGKTYASIVNPGNKPGMYRKENVGLATRHGLIYGKYTVKVKFTELLNKHHVWNGLTNAFWFINQSNGEWNSRRDCPNTGYIPKYDNNEVTPVRMRQLSYSEIDFEIRKNSRYWPAVCYRKGSKIPVDDYKDSDEVVVTCTNWDMACPQPKRFDAGVQYTRYQQQAFALNRWTHWYKALTGKQPAKDDELFGKDYYYFQLEWNPYELIWRIGPEKNRLRTVCYMNDRITSIPNNQMVMVFTQEYHPSKWWPLSQFLQELIPFMTDDREGKIYEIEVE